ncbi:hypothetical protein EVAR_24830_1 [Eumeta japonica]|uniref:Uncharacterized protein n=1 Tax=Eumeta variegata TaxID=151549 RepID=A0A4C1W484_EUMVA|nr:hypothetical protein EVAR_24830_1 [Eumeta japonica]
MIENLDLRIVRVLFQKRKPMILPAEQLALNFSGIADDGLRPKSTPTTELEAKYNLGVRQDDPRAPRRRRTTTPWFAHPPATRLQPRMPVLLFDIADEELLRRSSWRRPPRARHRMTSTQRGIHVTMYGFRL